MKLKRYTLLMIVLLLSVSFAGAQDARPELISEPAIGILPPDYYPGSSVLQNQQYYKVIFDDEGEATVLLKLIMANTGGEPMNEVKLDVPGTARLLSAVQEYQPWVEECVRYIKECEDSDCSEVCAQTSRYKQWPPTYFPSQVTTDSQADNTVYTFSLPQEVQSGEEATMLIAYKTSAYAEKILGAWNFNFETARQDSDIGQVRVAITVSEDLHLKGEDSGIDYRDESATDFVAESKVAAPGVQSQSLQQYSSSITYARGLVKTAEALDPYESFHVEGKYSSSYGALYLGRIIGGSIAAVLLLAGFIIGSAILAKRMNNRKSNKAGTAILSGILSAVAIIGVFLAGWFGTDMLSRFYYYGGIGSALGTLVMIVWVVLLIALFVVPPVLIGIKHGAMYGALAAGITLGLVFIIALIGTGVIIALGAGGGSVPYPVYY